VPTQLEFGVSKLGVVSIGCFPCVMISHVLMLSKCMCLSWRGLLMGFDDDNVLFVMVHVQVA
jgi:hypothetical protein